MKKAQPDCSQRNKGGKALSDSKTGYRADNGGRCVLGLYPVTDDKYASYPCELFQYLCQCRDSGAFDAIEIAVYERVKGAKRNGERENPQERRAALL